MYNLDGGNSGGFSSFSITGDLLPISGFSSSSSWKITGMPFDRNDLRSSSVPWGLDEEEEAIAGFGGLGRIVLTELHLAGQPALVQNARNDGGDQQHHYDDHRRQHEREQVVVLRDRFRGGLLRLARGVMRCIEPVAVVQRHQAHVLQAKLLAQYFAHLRPDRAVLVEQNVTQRLDLLLRAALVLAAQRRVEEGHLHLPGMVDRPNVVDLDVVRRGVAKHLREPFDKAPLHLGRVKLLVANVERQLEQDAVVALVVRVDYHHHATSSSSFSSGQRSFGSVSFVYTNVARLGSCMLLRMSRTIMFDSVTSPSTTEMPRAVSMCQSTLLANLRFRRSARLISWLRLRCDLCCCTCMSTFSVTVRLPESVARSL
uniref:Uncharacterized protein n=1 Tax=Anopheles merus TaxID=30066 RepID=A0A182V3S5_ANOME